MYSKSNSIKFQRKQKKILKHVIQFDSFGKTLNIYWTFLLSKIITGNTTEVFFFFFRAIYHIIIGCEFFSPELTGGLLMESK